MASLRNLFKEVMTLFAISIVIAFAVNYFSPKGIALTGQWDSVAGVKGSSPLLTFLTDNGS